MIITANGTRIVRPSPGRTYSFEALNMPSGASVAIKAANGGVAGQIYDTLSSADSVVVGPVAVNEIHVVTTGLSSGESITLAFSKTKEES